MKHIISIFLLLFSGFLYAQTNNLPGTGSPVNTNPAIPLRPSVSTTTLNQPASMPGSNTNPVTGTTINLKGNKKPSKPGESATGTTLKNSRSKVTKKNKVKANTGN